MSIKNCPLCSRNYTYDERKPWAKEKCYDIFSVDENFSVFHCDQYDVSFAIESRVLKKDFDAEQRERLLDLVVQHLIRSKYCVVNGEEKEWHFYFDPENKQTSYGHPQYINLAYQLRNYPKQVIDVANQILLSLSERYSCFGDKIFYDIHDHRVYFERSTIHSNDDGTLGILVDFGYLKSDVYNTSYIITAQGWHKIDELKKEEKVVNQAFIAMIFREEANSIREAFRRAIHEMGYMAVVLDEKEHNNQIVPEIFYEIRRSKFVVVDVTYPSYGAYYEAGYAQALDKEVIICCRRDVFDDTNKTPHFDISQKSIIVWDDEEDLVRRLKRRIEATIT